jgi:hypothetical protein
LACAPGKARVATAEPTPLADTPPVGFKRVDDWRFVDLDAPLSPVEQQLKRHFERVFANARHSSAYLCFAREQASFYDKHAALPNESLDSEMLGRCGAPAEGDYAIRTYYSDGTLLDSPLSDANLNDISKRLVEGLPTFTTFGITARALGPNMLVWLETADPGATICIDAPDAERNVLVRGEILREVGQAFAVINQGEAGIERCKAEAGVDWPKYAFKCPMAQGDEEAWVSVSVGEEGGWEKPLVDLPAHQVDWVPPVQYHRATPELPTQVSTRTALLATINALRTKQGGHELELAVEQSAFMEPIYERMFETDVSENTPLVLKMIRGEHVDGDVSHARIASGTAFDGDAADWLAFHMSYPISRATLMSGSANQIAIALHRDPAVGFGVAAVTYEVLTPERDEGLRDTLAKSISKLRGTRKTVLLENPPELEVALDAVARSSDPHAASQALDAALLRANLATKNGRYFTASFVPLSPGVDSLPPALRDPQTLAYGIVVTHIRTPAYGWHTPVAVLWLYTDHAPSRLAQQTL